MRVMVVGSGGREHALAWKLSLSQKCKKVFLVPGNDGAALEPRIEVVSISANDYDRIVEFAKVKCIDLVVVGPDQAMADGLVDRCKEEGVPAYGSSAAASLLESSKAFAKDVMAKANIPTARFAVFTDPKEAKDFLRTCGWSSGWAVKADGLALGKGVVVTDNLVDAERTVDEFMVQGIAGPAGKRLVIEEKLVGREVSAFYLCDGERAIRLAYACDYKQLLDNGKGPNTGGMGAYSPADWVSLEAERAVEEQIVEPLLKQMLLQKTPFQGTLFVGLMMTDAGPRVLEFNTRFGDPETQAVLPLIDEDFLVLLEHLARGTLKERGLHPVRLKPVTSLHIVLAAHGYPALGNTGVRKGDPIDISKEFLPSSELKENAVKVFFAGVKKQSRPKSESSDPVSLVTNGGRVLGLTVLAGSRTEARELAYQKVNHIQFNGLQKRSDVGV